MPSPCCSTLLRATRGYFRRPRIVSSSQATLPAAPLPAALLPAAPLPAAAAAAAAPPVNPVAQAPQARPDATCTLCNSLPHPGNYRCPHCYNTRYCSSECLETDEDAHLMVCETLRSPQRCLLPDERKHGATLARGLVFEADADRPRFVWVAVKADEPIGLRDFFGGPPIEAKFHNLCEDDARNTVRNRRIRDEVKVYTQGPIREIQDNQSIREVVKTCRRWLETEAQANAQSSAGQREAKVKAPLNEQVIICSCISDDNRLQKTKVNGVEMHAWKGNIAFMMSTRTKENNIPHFRDADSTDFRDIVDFLSVCQGHQLADRNHNFSEARAKKVEIQKCWTERRVLQMKEKSVLMIYRHLVPKDHPLIRDQGINPTWGRILIISQHIELPICALQVNNYLRIHPASPSRDWGHMSWTTLMVRSLIDPRHNRTPGTSNGANAPGDGDDALRALNDNELWATGYGNLDHISVVLVRADQKDLAVMDMKRLADWLTEMVLPRLKEVEINWEKPRASHPMFWTKEKYSELKITKEEYHDFWHQKEAKMLAELAGPAGLRQVRGNPCPYTV